MNDAEKTQKHNDAIGPLLLIIAGHGPGEADQWVILETLCVAIGQLHGRTAKDTAEFIDTMASRIAPGERQWQKQ